MASIGIGEVAAILSGQDEGQLRRLEGHNDGAVNQLLAGIQAGAQMDRAEREVRIHESQEQRSQRKFEDQLAAILSESNLKNIEEEQAAQVEAANAAEQARVQKELAEGQESARESAERREAVAPAIEQMRELFGDEWADKALDAYVPQVRVEGSTIVTPERNFGATDQAKANAAAGLGEERSGQIAEVREVVSPHLVEAPAINRQEAARRLHKMYEAAGLNPEHANFQMALASTDLTLASRRAAARTLEKEKAAAAAEAQRAAAEQEKWGYANKLNEAKAGTEKSTAALNKQKVETQKALARKHNAAAIKMLRRPVERAPGQSYVKATQNVNKAMAEGKVPPMLADARRRFVSTMKGEKRRSAGAMKEVESMFNAASFLTGKKIDAVVQAQLRSSVMAAEKIADATSPNSYRKLIGMQLVGMNEDDAANTMQMMAMNRIRTSDGSKTPGELILEVEREFNQGLADYGRRAMERINGETDKPVSPPSFMTGPGTVSEARKLDAGRGVVDARDPAVEEAVRMGRVPTKEEFARTARDASKAFGLLKSRSTPEQQRKLDEVMQELKPRIQAYMTADLTREEADAMRMQLHSELVAMTKEWSEATAE